MDFEIDIGSALHAVDGIAIVDGKTLVPGSLEYKVLDVILPKLGQMSQEAQGLPAPVTTTAAKLKAGDQKLYLALAKESIVLGMLKTGPKALSIYDRKAHIHQRTFVALLDFYVNAACRRQGVGLTMFQAMLEEEAKTRDGAKGAWEIAYDKPSKLCLSFLKKHFYLENYIEQPNNYVVFDEYFRIIEQDEKGILGIHETVYQDSPSGISRPKNRHFSPLESSVLPTKIPDKGKEGVLMQTTYGSTYGSIDDVASPPITKSPYEKSGYLSRTRIDVFGYPSDIKRNFKEKETNSGTLDPLNIKDPQSPYERLNSLKYGTGAVNNNEIDNRTNNNNNNNINGSSNDIQRELPLNGSGNVSDKCIPKDNNDNILNRSFKSDYTLNYTMGPDADKGFADKQKLLDRTLVLSAKQLGKCSSLSSPSLMRTHMSSDTQSYL